MRRCHCQGFIPNGLTRCPNCGALSAKPSKAALAAMAAAAQLITACACYGGPATRCPTLIHRGMTINSCTAAIDCTTPLTDGGSPAADPTDQACFTGASPDGGP